MPVVISVFKYLFEYFLYITIRYFKPVIRHRKNFVLFLLQIGNKRKIQNLPVYVTVQWQFSSQTSIAL